MYPDSYYGYGARNEFTIMNNLYREGFPVPKVLLFEENKKILGKPFIIMEFIEGRMFYQLIENSSLDKIPNLMKKFTELLVNLHQINWKKIVTDKALKDTNDPFFAVNLILEKMDLLLEKYDLDLFESTIEWLRKNIKKFPVSRIGFNHKDYHWVNILATEDNSLFLVDWSISNVSDIREDIARTICVFTMVGNVDPIPLFLKYYEKLSGKSIGDLSFFEVAAALEYILFFILPIVNPDLAEDRDRFMERIKSHRSWIRNLYKYMTERTKILIAEIEELLE